MRSTFFGLETAKRGMYTQQSALYVTGHNISNANTPGYTRQRVNFQQTTPYAYPGMNRPGGAGQFGTGVEAGSVERIRDQFLDVQFRTQNTNVGQFGALRESYLKMEEILDDSADSGLSKTMDAFWNSLQTLAGNTENKGAREVVVGSAQKVADTFNYYYKSLSRVQDDLGQQIKVKETEINDIINKINDLNKNISEVEPHGMIPNDLYDARDALVDQLSGLVNIKVEAITPVPYANALPIADGLYRIEMLKDDGSSYNPPQHIVGVTEPDGKLSMKEIKINIDNTKKEVTSIEIGGTSFSGADFNISGEIGGLIKSYGYDNGSGTTQGSYPEMIRKINNMAKAFADEFNAIHREGYALGDTNKSGKDFFEYTGTDFAKTLKVRDEIVSNSNLIAAGGGSGDSGDNKNAQLLADLKLKEFSEYITKGSLPSDMKQGNIQNYYSGLIGKLGVDSSSAKLSLDTSLARAISAEQNRQSVSAVSLDEEMVNMIKFQHAYNASARNITVVDEMLDKIINGLGVIGR